MDLETPRRHPRSFFASVALDDEGGELKDGLDVGGEI
jgi:hypothetical protein